MAVYCVTGKLGAGKTLVAVSRIQKYLNSKRRVATNLDLNLEKLVNPFAKKTNVIRLPDIPTEEDLNAIGKGYDGAIKSDDYNGALVLDECAKWLNSRDYRDKNRQGLINWMIHARKKRWDIFFIIQDISVMDKQFRDLFCEHVVYCRRMDKYSIPFLSAPYKFLFGKPLTGMKLHIGLVRYGEKETSTIVDRWMYRGTDLYSAYDTEQGFSDVSDPIRSILPPYYVYGRYTTKLRNYINGIHNWSVFPFLLIGSLLGYALASWTAESYEDYINGTFACSDSYEKLIGCDTKPNDLKKILAAHKVNQDTRPEDSSSDLVAQIDKIIISGSVVRSLGGITYTFSKEGESFYPSEYGYKVQGIDYCSAQLISTTNPQTKKNIHCAF